MALRVQREQAVRMRKAGASYSQIKQEIGVSKSTLSLWLRDIPLSEKRLRMLRDFNTTRIEKYRETCRKRREDRWKTVRAQMSKDIGTLTKREIFIAGLFLYWGEGGKTVMTNISVTNTDPAMLRFFLAWLTLLGVPKERVWVKIHLYRDMDTKKELLFWSKALNVPLRQFRKPYIKHSSRSKLSYPQRFTHGTGNIIYGNRDITERVLLGLEHLRDQFAGDVTI